MLRVNLKNIALIITVLSIWIAVSFRFVNSLYPERNSENPSITDKVNVAPEVIREKKTIAINQHYRDPFLGGDTRKKVKRRLQQKAVKVVWPSISYRGSMENAQTHQRLFFVQLDNGLQYWRVGKTYGAFRLLQGTKTHLVVRFNGELRKIPKAP